MFLALLVLLVSGTVRADDPVVDVEGSRNFAEALERSKVFKYTEWDTGGHGIVGRVIDDPTVHRWLFEQRNK